MCYIVYISHSLHWRYIKIALRKYVINKFIETSGIKLTFVLENVYDKPKLETTKAVVSFPCVSEMVASQMTVKMSNNNSSQQIAVPTMQK